MLSSSISSSYLASLPAVRTAICTAKPLREQYPLRESMEPAAASLPTLDALLAHDGKDVGTALPTEVWASTSQGTLRCWSEGAKLRLAKATDATAAPADAVLIAFKSAEAEREVVAADGAKALVAAVAAGKISVRGDVVALRPVAERIVAALQRGAPIAVDAPKKRTDGVVVYAVESCVEINQ